VYWVALGLFANAKTDFAIRQCAFGPPNADGKAEPAAARQITLKNLAQQNLTDQMEFRVFGIADRPPAAY
jgi:hypothetical protein